MHVRLSFVAEARGFYYPKHADYRRIKFEKKVLPILIVSSCFPPSDWCAALFRRVRVRLRLCNVSARYSTTREGGTQTIALNGSSSFSLRLICVYSAVASALLALPAITVYLGVIAVYLGGRGSPSLSIITTSVSRDGAWFGSM